MLQRWQVGDGARWLAVGETVILLTPLFIHIETPTNGRGGCSRMTVSSTRPGGRWYVWKRWWFAETSSLFIGEHQFKANTVTKFGPFCRRREHLASSTDEVM